MNTLIGFACMMEAGIIEVDHHGNGDSHSHDAGHHHSNKTDHQDFSLTQRANCNKKENCCNDNVLKFERIDKTVHNIAKASLECPAAILHQHWYRHPLIISTLSSSSRLFSFKKWVPPPNQDIRVSIQSFQI